MGQIQKNQNTNIEKFCYNVCLFRHSTEQKTIFFIKLINSVSNYPHVKLFPRIVSELGHTTSENILKQKHMFVVNAIH